MRSHQPRAAGAVFTNSLADEIFAEDRAAQRQSVARGQAIFQTRAFTINGVARPNQHKRSEAVNLAGSLVCYFFSVSILYFHLFIRSRMD